MSLVWPNKDPDELLDYSVDWTAVTENMTITNVVWSVRTTNYPTETILEAGRDLTFASNGAETDSIQNISQALSGKSAIIYIAGGEDKRDYTFICTITTDLNSVLQRAVILRCRSV